jgi:hypothetical protein
MTEEHAFIEWKAEQYKHQNTEEELEFVEHLHNFPRYFKKTFLDGYHEYQKEHEWHYVKDGVYPTDDKKVLCILGDFENDNLEVGYYSQVEGDSKRWRFEDYDLPDDSEEDWGVSAWKEIVLPELKESE